MKLVSHPSQSVLLLILSLQCTTANDLGRQIIRTSRRLLNFGSTFGSACNADTPYERVAGHPVFAVTTAWGSPYMNMEKLTDLDEVIKTGTSNSSPQSLSEEQNEYRMVALYFLDPDDALAVHGEMKQMENMQTADIRLTSFSLAKAIRQASSLGNGLPTGAPPDPLDGNYKPPDDGSVLRYKLVPPKRQLYYAARCIGKERVGLFSTGSETTTSGAEDAQAAIMGNSALESLNLQRRREKRERKVREAKKTAQQQAAAHMEGYTGIPVFYAHGLHKQLPFVKRLVTGAPKQEIPLFFNYEDLQSAWKLMKQRNSSSASKNDIPNEPPAVEVFNLWDVLSSMDKQQIAKKQQSRKDIQAVLLNPVKKRFDTKTPLDLDAITFVPSSRSVHYKEAISTRGNGKARLPRMR